MEDQIRELMRFKQYSIRTEESYIGWYRQFVKFHDLRHPQEMGKAEVEAFLTHLAVNRGVVASTQNQALNALAFLYREVLKHFNKYRSHCNGIVAAVFNHHAYLFMYWHGGCKPPPHFCGHKISENALNGRTMIETR